MNEPGTSRNLALRVCIAPRKVGRWLAIIIGCLALASVVEQYVIHILERADLEEFLIAVDLDAEGNISTWYASAVLAASAVALAAIAVRARRRGGPFVGLWRLLSGLFWFLSIDEIAQLHEHLGRLQSIWDTHGLFYFAWVIPGTIFVALVGLLYARFLAHLPAATRRRFVISAALYVGGAIGVEALGGWRAETHGMNNMTHSLIATVEEVMEMTGSAMFLVALLSVLADGRNAFELVLGAGAPANEGT